MKHLSSVSKKIYSSESIRVGRQSSIICGRKILNYISTIFFLSFFAALSFSMAAKFLSYRVLLRELNAILLMMFLYREFFSIKILNFRREDVVVWTLGQFELMVMDCFFEVKFNVCVLWVVIWEKFPVNLIDISKENAIDFCVS